MIGVSKPARQTRVSVYFDTPDLRLQQDGLSLRLRRDGRHTVQMIEAVNGAANGINGAIMTERAVRGMQPDLSTVPGTSLAPLLEGIDTEALRPVFATRIRRAVYQVATELGTIALSLDLGEINTGPERTPVSELQFELTEGDATDLFRLARTLGEVAPLRLVMHSKAERGSALVEGEPHPVTRASEVHLDPVMTCAAAFRAIAENCIRHVVANEVAMRQGEAEAVHQMRVDCAACVPPSRCSTISPQTVTATAS